MLSLRNICISLSCAVLAATPAASDRTNKHLTLYRVLLEDDAKLLDHAAWAQGIHVRNARRSDDIGLGLMAVTGTDKYDFYTDEATIATILKHPQVGPSHRLRRLGYFDPYLLSRQVLETKETPIFEDPVPDHQTIILDEQGWRKIDGATTWEQNNHLQDLNLTLGSWPYPRSRTVIKGPFRSNNDWRFVGCYAPRTS